jgi:L,D-transpeptidase catalytic domain
MWYSRKYHMSPMPHSLFFRGGYAIHGTGAIRQLGRPASHGCVRLHPANARAVPVGWILRRRPNTRFDVNAAKPKVPSRGAGS